MGHGSTEVPAPLSHEEMKKHDIPLAWRDRCSSLLVPLNKCRREGWFLPWNCQDERHAYEECQYKDFQRRVKELKQIKEQQQQEAGQKE